ncbi:MAG: hypothetical protein ACF8R7_17265 [Phycisphaerales bacterium JB039]
MAIVPPSRVGALEFYETHLPLWTADPTIIGLTLTQVTDLQAAVDTARTQWNNAQAARDASVGATGNFHDAIDTMRTLGSAAIAEIKAYAKTTQNPGVYATAGIPAPATPTPAPAPATPSEITAEVLASGSIRLRWKALQPAPGAEVYTQIQRRLTPTGAFTILGDTGEKEFIDATVPAGTAQAQYQLIAKRGGQMSDPSLPISVLLGVPSNESEGGLSLAA